MRLLLTVPPARIPAYQTPEVNRMPYPKTSLRAEQRALREKMRELGMSHRQIAVELARRYRLRPRAAWRNAYGWSLTEAAERISAYAGHAGLGNGSTVAMTGAHLSEHENWPGEGAKPTGRRPTPYLLSLLAAVYGCAVQDLLDVADYERMPATDRLVLDKTSRGDERQSAQDAAKSATGVSERRPGSQSSPSAISGVSEEMMLAGLPGRPALSNAAWPGQQSSPAAPGLDHFPALDALRALEHGYEEGRETGPLPRNLAGLPGTSVLGSILDLASDERPVDAEPFVSILAGRVSGLGSASDGQPTDLGALSAAAADARRWYQACRYSELTSQLPDLLARLHSACLSLDGDAGSLALALSADAYHVAAGFLLKLDDQGLAYLAADRSMRAAMASKDPVTVGASARIITHALMNGGHLGAAVSIARSHAEQLDRDVSSHTAESLSVYGSLLLRGAIAAAQSDQRATAHELLEEADDAARRIGTDGNLRWTAFGPTNARLHRVNVAVTLGDAGTAVDVARGIDLSAITVTERKATLLIDTARAYLQWRRYEKAYIALRAAEQIAHEEVARRPSVHYLVRELVTSAPPTLRREAASFAAGIGVSR